MIKKIPVFILIFYYHFIFPQSVPQSFLLPGEKNYLPKSVAENPVGNSITDIVALGDTVWVGTGNGLSLTTDGGLNWTNFFNTPAFGSESISAIGYDQQTGIFWAATASSVNQNGENLPQGTGFRITSDNGLTWTTLPQPLDAEDDTVITYGANQISALPVTVAIQNLCFDIAFTQNTVWIATFAGGLRKSTDSGLSWQRVLLPPDYLNEISPADTLDFCLSPVAGNFCAEGNLNHRVFSVVATDSVTLYVGTAGGINKSTDNGISWTKFSHTNQFEPISGNFIVAMGYNDADSTLWAATWKAEGETEFYAVSKTTDRGLNWQTYLDDERCHNFGFLNNHVIAATDNGAFRSSDNGSSWIVPTSIVDDLSGISLQTNTFFSAAGYDQQTWLGSTEGLALLNEDGAGMWSGNWKLFIASQPLASKTESYAFPNPFSPKLDVLKIKYSTGGKRATVTIRIFDFGMNYLRTIIQNAERGNPISVVDNADDLNNGVIDFWDGKDDNGNPVPNGVYFYRIEVDDENPVFGKILVLQ